MNQILVPESAIYDPREECWEFPLSLGIVGRHRVECSKLNKRTGKRRKLWEAICKNTWTNTGEASLLDSVFRGTSPPSSLALALSNAASYSKSSSVISLESSGGGYARKTLNRGTTDWGAPAVVDGLYTVKSSTQTWTALGGSISQAKYCCLMNGTQLIFFFPLPGAAVVPSGADLAVTCNVSHDWITDQGIQEILNYYFRNSGAYITGTATPASFYTGLTGVGDTTQTLLSSSSTLSTASGSELSAGGYARQAIERNSTGWPTSGTESGSYQIVSKTIRFPNGGSSLFSAQSGMFTFSFLGTVSSGSAGALLAYQLLKAINDKPEGTYFSGKFRIKVR